MEAHIIDIRDEEGMKLLVDGSALSIWELLRRYGEAMPATAIERVVRFSLPEVERALRVLIDRGLAQQLPPRGRRRVTEYANLKSSIVVHFRKDDAEDARALATWMPRIEVAMATAAIRLEVTAGAEMGAESLKRSVRLSTHLEPKEAEELRARVDDLLAFIRLLESRHAGEEALDSFLCNYRVDLELQPLRTPTPASALVTVRPAGRAVDVSRAESSADAASLSPREREVAVGIVNGRSRADIAERLGITASTVATLTKRLYRKLGVHSKSQLTKRLVGRGELP